MTAPAIFALMFAAAAIVLWYPLARRGHSPRWFGLVLRSGHAFLPLGLLLGMALSGTPATSARLLDDLWPLVAFTAGWVGYGVGIRGDWHHLRTLGIGGLARGVVPSLFAATLVSGTGLAVMLAAGVDLRTAIPLALLLGAAGACSGAPLMARLANRAAPGSSDRDRFSHLVTAARADDIVVCCLALAAFATIPDMPGAPTPVMAGVLTLVGGVALGGVAWLLLAGTTTHDERLLLGIAVLGIGAGFGAWIEVSPAVVCAVLAVTLVGLPSDRARSLREPITKLGRPAIVILMLATGLAIAPHLSWVMPVAGLALVGLRLVAFEVSGRVLHSDLGSDARLLSAPGQLGVVVSFTFYHLVGGDLAADVLGAVAFASFVDQVTVARRVVRRVHVAVEAPWEEV